jgi:hypothetical protein
MFNVLPQTLIILMPLFALMLKIAYWFKHRMYMEHLIVALHSHSFISLALTLVISFSWLRDWLAPDAGFWNGLLGWAMGLTAAWIPVYLLLMQKRVYGQGWPMTLIKFGVSASATACCSAWAGRRHPDRIADAVIGRGVEPARLTGQSLANRSARRSGAASARSIAVVALRSGADARSPVRTATGRQRVQRVGKAGRRDSGMKANKAPAPVPAPRPDPSTTGSGHRPAGGEFIAVPAGRPAAAVTPRRPRTRCDPSRQALPCHERRTPTGASGAPVVPFGAIAGATALLRRARLPIHRVSAGRHGWPVECRPGIFRRGQRLRLGGQLPERCRRCHTVACASTP